MAPTAGSTARCDDSEQRHAPDQCHPPVNKTLKEVVELKPDNPRAIARGLKQLAEYVKELKKMFGGKWTGRLETYK